MFRLGVTVCTLSALLVWRVYAQDDSPSDCSEDNPCDSFGVDFQDGGSYFQNISSSDPFTFVSIFEGQSHGFHANSAATDWNQVVRQTLRTTFWWIRKETNTFAVIRFADSNKIFSRDH
jgi:hypothetical protein